MAIPFIDLQRFEDDFLERWAQRSGDISRHTRFVGGAAVERLEHRLADAADVTVAVGCANGTDALQLALRGLGIGNGDRVLIPDATFWATFEAVVNVGAKPVTVDIDPRDLQMDYERFLEAAKEFRPAAAILVHLYGWGSARLDDFREECRRMGIPLIEDAAQAWGVTWRGRSIFRDALISTVSFYPAKVLGACGDAGAVLCNDEALADRVRRLGNHGRTEHYEHGLVGWNSRLGGLEAAWLDVSMDYFPARLSDRRRAADRYRRALVGVPFEVAGPPDGFQENAYLNVSVLSPDHRPAMAAALHDHEIGYGTVYPGAMSRQPGAADHLAGRLGGEHADRLARGVLNLPLFHGITDDEIDEVIDVVLEAARTLDPAGERRLARRGSGAPSQPAAT